MIDPDTLARAVEHSPLAVVITDHEGAIEYVNPKFVSVTGYSASEVLGRNPRILSSGLQSREFYEEMWTAILAGDEWRGDFANRRKDGSLYWERGHISGIRDSEGRISHFVAVKEDVTELRSALESLRLSEERFELAMKGASDGLFDWDLRTSQAFYSPRWKSMLGYGEDEVEPTIDAFRRLLHPNDASPTFSAIAAYTTGAAPRYEGQIRMRHKSGHYVYARARAWAARDAQGAAYRLVGTVVDTTDAVRTQQRLDAQYQVTAVLATSTTLMETAPRLLAAFGGAGRWAMGVLWAVDPGAGVLRCLSAWHAADLDLGEAEAQLRTRTVPRGSGPAGIAWEQGAPIWLEDQAGLEGPEAAKFGLHASVAVPFVMNGRMLGALQLWARYRRPREDAWLEMIASLHSQVVQTIERRQVESALREAERDYREIFDTTPVGIYRVTPGGRFLTANAAFARLLGCESPSALAALPPEVVTGMLRPEDLSRLLKSGARDEQIENQDMPMRRLDGRHVWIRTSTRPVRVGGQLAYFQGIAEDITAAREADQLKSDFVSFATHQLRTPLSGVRWLLELAADAESAEELQGYVTDAREATGRMITLVNDLLATARLESGKLLPAPSAIDVAAMTADAIAELRPLAEARGQTITVTGDTEPRAWGDPQLTREVIANLLSNASKYTPQGGAMYVDVRAVEGSVQWAVRDTGIGIPETARAFLFQKFYRAGNASKLDTEGTGLGLYLAKLILDRSGGRIWCDSSEGEGSTFTFTLPMPAAEEAA